MSGKPFWKTKTLAQMSEAEWESLCDGCGRCCLISIEFEDTKEFAWTDVSCRLFDSGTCRCSDYRNRARRVRDCVKLTPQNVRGLDWMPPTCAYKLVDQGKDLYWWHPLVSGDPETVHSSGASVRGKTRPHKGQKVQQLVGRITEWPNPPKRKPRT